MGSVTPAGASVGGVTGTFIRDASRHRSPGQAIMALRPLKAPGLELHSFNIEALTQASLNVASAFQLRSADLQVMAQASLDVASAFELPSVGVQALAQASLGLAHPHPLSGSLSGAG